MNRHLLLTVAAVAAIGAASPASSALLFDENVTPDVIFGSGNANGGFTVDRVSGEEIELGLRAKLRFNDSNLPENTFNSNGDGTYTFESGLPPTGFGFAPGSTSTAVWNFEWSINVNLDGGGGADLAELTYVLEIDFDPGLGTNFLSFDPINVAFADHAIGTNSTPNGGGSVAADDSDYSSLIIDNQVAQNSWNMEFFDDPSTGFAFDGRNAGIYDIRLSAFTGAAGKVAETQIQVESVSVPEPASLALVGLGLAGLGLRRRRARA